MGLEDGLKEVDFNTYCQRCRHREKDEWQYPCSDCVPISVRHNTCVPKFYEGPRLIQPDLGTKNRLGLK